MRYFKLLRVMPDFTSSGIWHNKLGFMIDHEDLGLSKELIVKFEKWINDYDDCFKFFPKDTVNSKKLNVVHKTGLLLARELQTLFPKAKIWYWKEKYVKGKFTITKILI
ncbi:MAG: hypothetical protein Q7R33_00960 [Nitrosarchaeum sp.]|nr:hypothetical protein [Nitrosarchaeum sp.]